MRLLDAHCDTVTNALINKWELLDNEGHISLKKLAAFDAPVIFFAIYYDKVATSDIFNYFIKAHDFLTAQITKNADLAAMALSVDDILANIAAGKISAVPAIEEGGILEGKMDNLYTAAKMGVRYITLTWNHPNEIGEPSAKDGGPLTPFGKDLLREMEALKILPDVSHLSVPGFWDVYKLTKGPFIASHSNAKAICNHHRNLNDDQLKAIGEKGGCIGLNFFSYFVAEGGEGATIDQLCRHVDHTLSLAGEDSVGLGTDFDGMTKSVQGLENITKLTDLHQIFTKRYGPELTDKIFYGNFMRVLTT